MGPTATGKTDLAIALANSYPIEIISVDSALIYTDMNIGTAKPNMQHMKSVPHHLINILSPCETYSVANFVRDSQALIYDINKRDKLPVLVGGTIMYYNSLMHGLSPLPSADINIRRNLYQQSLEIGWPELYQQLCLVDSLTAQKINANDHQRIVRALEVFHLTGQALSTLQQQNPIQPPADIQFLSLSIVPETRQILHQRINTRFERMLDNGLIDEVKMLQIKYPNLTADHPSMRCVGYSQVWQYLQGQINTAELILHGQAATRQLAKRQITWLRSMPSINVCLNDNLEFSILYNTILENIRRVMFQVHI